MAPGNRSVPKVPAAPSSDKRAMYEDIEIMRQLMIHRLINSRVVAAQCTQCHGASVRSYGQAAFWDADGNTNKKPHWAKDDGTLLDFDRDGFVDLFIAQGANPHGAIPISIEGSYIRGQGIVFSVSLPPVPRNELDATTQAPPEKAKSEWERTRNRLRGQNAEPSAQARNDSLTDSLMRLLAENGKNFSQLPGTEGVTILVTFRPHGPALLFGRTESQGGVGSDIMGGSSAATGSGMPAARMSGPGVPGMGGGTGAPGGGTGIGSGGSGMMGGPGMGTGGEVQRPEPLTEDRELELLADLHLKRNNLTEAAAALERAVTKARSITLDQNLPYDQAKARMEQRLARVRELIRKLAEVYLKQGNLEAAKNALAAVQASLQVEKTSAAPKSTPTIRLPNKLIISAPKSALDQGDRISPAEFRKLISVEVLEFDVPAQPQK